MDSQLQVFVKYLPFQYLIPIAVNWPNLVSSKGKGNSLKRRKTFGGCLTPSARWQAPSCFIPAALKYWSPKELSQRLIKSSEIWPSFR